jgi:hypothetical protein
MENDMRKSIDQVKNFGKSLNENEDVIANMTLNDKVEKLKKDYSKQFNKYYEAMNYRIGSVEINALYNVLVLRKKSKDELTSRWESKVREILLR